MLQVYQHGPVVQVQCAGTILRRALIYVSAYYFDETLIDTGPPKTGRQLASWARDRRIGWIINTHHHEDHVGGNGWLNVPAFAPAEVVAFLQRPYRLPLYRRVVWGQPRRATAQPLGEEVCTAHHLLKVIHTPGQSPEHVALLLADKGWLFSGDLFISEHTRYVRLEDNIGDWLASLHKVLDYPFDTLFCGHAGVVPDGKAAVLRKIAYWEQLRDDAWALADSGRTETAIRAELLGSEGFLTRWSRGRYSKLNLVRALLALPRTEGQRDTPGT